MLVDLAYGTDGLEVDLPEDTLVLTPRHGRPVADPQAEIRRALRQPVAGPPLAELVRPGQKVAISVCDATRAQPRRLVVPALLDELERVVDLADVVVVVATGTHRPSTEAERLELFGAEVLGRVRVVDHDARDASSLVDLGVMGDGVPVRLARAFVEADVRITTGLVEPHFFAGFSGGPKMVAPGLASLETVLSLHDARRIGDARATFGVTEGNPVHDDVRAIAAAVGVRFSLDVVLDGDQSLVQAFAGELFATHRAACELVRQSAMLPVEQPFDVVVSTNAGFPLDQDLYQSVKGVAAACEVVRPGGLVVLAAECREGFPSHGNIQRLLGSASTPEELFERFAPGVPTEPDQWQAQVLARCLRRARLAVRTDGLSPAELAAVHLEATADVGGTVREELARLGGAGPGAVGHRAVGHRARCCVLPEGPRTIPYLLAA